LAAGSPPRGRSWGFAGLVPTEYSSGKRTRRGHITKAGPEAVRTALVEAAWAYQHRPAIGVGLKRRQAGASPQTLARSWKAQHRLHATYRKMIGRGRPAGWRRWRSRASSPGSCGPR
jgi:transposase